MPRTALVACLGAVLPLVSAVRDATGATDQAQAPTVFGVTSCADSGTGTLREAIGLAGNFAVIDMTGLACSTITLASALIIPHEVANLTLDGPTNHALTISGNDHSRVLVHNGEGTLTLDHVTVTHGRYDNGYYGGGCIYALGSVTLQNSTVSNCTLSLAGLYKTYGGGIYAHGSVVLTDSVVSGNQAVAGSGFSNGGGIAARGSNSNLTCTRSTIRDNVAVGPTQHAQSGAALVFGTAHVDYCTISGNQSEYIGALHVIGDFTCTNSTISGNTATKNHGGLFTQASVTLDHCTIAFNTQDAKLFGAGLYTSGSTIIADSTIIARNTSTQNGTSYDVALKPAATFTGSHNLINGSNHATPVGTLGGDPKLAPLAANGGPTLTHALAPSSPAVEAGDNVHGLFYDQRGVGHPRVGGVLPDIGAFELSDTIFTNGFQ